MKPKDLKSLFTWESRRVLIQDRVWYFPDYYEDPDFIFPGWDHPSLFDNKNPIFVEYCSGNGAWIVEKAIENPDINWVAVEKQFKRVRKIWSKIKNHKLKNLLVVSGEGYKWTERYVPDNSVEQVFVNFPDPWPKDRHAKHRIVQPLFTNQIGRILASKGRITLVTDDPEYSNQMIAVFRKNPHFQSIYPEPYFVTHLEQYGSSFFRNLWEQKGRTIHFHKFEVQ